MRLKRSPDWIATGLDGSRFGYDVASLGDVNGDGLGDIAVGAPADSRSLEEAGRVEVFLGSLEGLAAEPDWWVDGQEARDLLGNSVAGVDVNGDGFDDLVVAVPGAHRFEVYAGSPDGLATAATWTLAQPGPGSFGRSARAAGDVDGDGFGDVVIGDAAWFQVFFGSATGPYGGSMYHEMLSSDDYNVVAPAGDVNGDGHDDVITGLTFANTAAAYYGPDFGYSFEEPDWEVTGLLRLGAGATGVGDVDGDGYDDVAVADPAVATSRGEVYVHAGSSAGLGTAPAAVLTAGEPWLELGHAIGAGGDVNGDGFDDVVVGNRAGALPFPSQERVFLFTGGEDGVASAPIWSAYGRTPAPVGARAGGLRVSRLNGDRVGLRWAEAVDSCEFPDDFQVYQGVLGEFDSHRPVVCSPFVPFPDYQWSLDAGPGNAYFLVVPYNGASEGSYGRNSAGAERGPGAEACRPQRVLACD